MWYPVHAVVCGAAALITEGVVGGAFGARLSTPGLAAEHMLTSVPSTSSDQAAGCRHKNYR